MTSRPHSFLNELNAQWNGTIECCGIILKDLTIISLRNWHPVPEHAFRIKTEDYEPHIPNMLGTWHSHPHGSANLSMEDYVMFKSQPQWFHFIVGCGKVWGYCVNGSKVLLHETHSIPWRTEAPLP